MERTTSSRISTQVLEESAFFPLPPTTPLVQQNRHSLLDTDSLLAHSMPDLFTAAASGHDDDDCSSKPLEPAKADAPQTRQVVSPPSQPSSPPQPAPADAFTAQPSLDQHAAAVGLADTRSTPHPEPPAGPAKPAAHQPASVQHSPPPTTIAFLPGKTQGVKPDMTVHDESVVEGSKLVTPATVPLGLLQAAPISVLTEDKVAPNGCLHMFCCSKTAGSKQKTKGSVLVRCQQVFRKGRQ